MDRRPLGPGGRSPVSVVGLGTWQRLEAAARRGDVKPVIDAAFDAGVQVFDMSNPANPTLLGSLNGVQGVQALQIVDGWSSVLSASHRSEERNTTPSSRRWTSCGLRP